MPTQAFFAANGPDAKPGRDIARAAELFDEHNLSVYRDRVE